MIRKDEKEREQFEGDIHDLDKHCLFLIRLKQEHEKVGSDK